MFHHDANITTDFLFHSRLVQHELRNCKFFAGFIGDSYGDCMLQYDKSCSFAVKL